MNMFGKILLSVMVSYCMASIGLAGFFPSLVVILLLAMLVSLTNGWVDLDLDTDGDGLK